MMHGQKNIKFSIKC